jgi:hypothetical protein
MFIWAKIIKLGQKHSYPERHTAFLAKILETCGIAFKRSSINPSIFNRVLLPQYENKEIVLIL